MVDTYLPNCLESVCNIEQVSTIQASFQGECKKKIQQIPSLQIAYLSNIRNQSSCWTNSWSNNNL